MEGALGPALLMLGMHLTAQLPQRDAKQIEEALASSKAEVTAWAAHDARKLGDKKLVVPLQRALATRRRGASQEVSLYLLDALIQLDAHMPASDLVPLLDDELCGVAAFVLLVREPKHNEAELLELFRRDWPNATPARDSLQDRRALATGNLLALQGPPGFAALLAAQVELDLQIVVSDGAAQSGVRRGIRVNPLRLPKPPEGWPPLPIYEFEHPTLRIQAAQVAVPKTMAVGVTRRSSDESQDAAVRFQVAGTTANATPASDSLRWLCTVAGLPVPATQRRLRQLQPQAYVAAVTAARDELQQFVDRLRERLVAARAMTPDEAKHLERKVAVSVQDDRSDASVPLPAIPAR